MQSLAHAFDHVRLDPPVSKWAGCAYSVLGRFQPLQKRANIAGWIPTRGIEFRGSDFAIGRPSVDSGLRLDVEDLSSHISMC
jgi:hypothetical protein